MKQEFEDLAKIKVTEETYSKVIEPMYLASNLLKREFIRFLNLKVLAAPGEKDIKKMCIRDRSGYMKKPPEIFILKLQHNVSSFIVVVVYNYKMAYYAEVFLYQPA